MIRRRRDDFEWAWQHITNRGIAKRAMFERFEDVRFFLSRLAWMVQQELLEVHAFSVLTTHFHILARSPSGELSRAMRRIQSDYSRRFNRRRGRDGPLVRGRFFSKVVDSDVYRDNVVRYIDANAVEAGLVAMPHWHQCCSAYWYGNSRRSPPWLTRNWVEARICDRCGLHEFDSIAYRRYYQPELTPDHEEWIQRRLAAGEGPPDPLDDLIRLAPPRVAAWLQANAERADGEHLRAPLFPASALGLGCARFNDQLVRWQASRPRLPGRPIPTGDVARAGLWADLAALGPSEIGVRLGRCRGGVDTLVSRHRDWMRTSGDYACIIGRVVHVALQQL